MRLANPERLRWVATIALAASLLPLILGGLPGLHDHGLQGAEQEIVTLADLAEGESGCALCALHRSLEHSIPGSADEPCRLEANNGPVAAPIIQAPQPVSAGSAPRAPPVHDSIWNV
jgi:hypothetical protein